MSGAKDFFDDFYTETMTEMAGNFFSRRKEMEARLEGFQRLAEEVRGLSGRASRRWATLLALLVDRARALEFLQSCGVAPGSVPAPEGGPAWRFKPLFALTERGRYLKAVRYAYEAAREATSDYVQGAYGVDPRNPKRRVLLPNYQTLKDLAVKVNAEVEAVNASQTPSSVLAYCRSLDVAETVRENVTGGGMGGDMCRIDRDLAFKPVDFEALGLPELPDLPPLDDVRERLDRLADAVWADRQADAASALRSVTC